MSGTEPHCFASDLFPAAKSGEGERNLLASADLLKSNGRREMQVVGQTTLFILVQGFLPGHTEKREVHCAGSRVLYFTGATPVAHLVSIASIPHLRQ